MKKTFFLAYMWVGSFLFLSPFANASTWEIDASHSYIGFSIRHMMVSNVKGNFGKFAGVLELNDTDVLASKVNVNIDTASIVTGDAKRDAHLRDTDFFDAKKFPHITFTSTKMEKVGTQFKITGDLNMHGVTKSVVLMADEPSQPIKDPWGNIKKGVTASAKINRKDFGIVWNKTMDAGALAVGEEVSLSIELELTKKKEEPKK